MDPIDALARLQLARARAGAGEIAAARTTYEDLLRLWASADSSARPVRLARQEHGALRADPPGW